MLSHTTLIEYAIRFLSLERIFYEGSDIITSNAFDNCESLNVTCVSPDYKSTSFCGRNVSSSDKCRKYQSMFNHCFKAVYINDDLIQKLRNNATAEVTRIPPINFTFFIFILLLIFSLLLSLFNKDCCF